MPKLSPALYRAIIDEAHTHDLRVLAHIATLADAKALLRAGLDGFLFPALVESAVPLTNGRGSFSRSLGEFVVAGLLYFAKPRWLAESARIGAVAPEEVARLAEFVAGRKPEQIEAAREEWARLARNVAKLNAAGVRIALGTDVGGASAGGLFGWAEHVELEHGVSRLAPAQAIVAATGTAAAVLGLDRLGTVAAGKSADFIVLDRSPLGSITMTRRIGRIYLRGQEVPRPQGRVQSLIPNPDLITDPERCRCVR